jgi:hypothetical protein
MKQTNLLTLILPILIICISLGFYYSLGDDHGTTAVQISKSNMLTPPSITNPKDLLGAWQDGANVLQGRFASRGVTWIASDSTRWLYFIGGDADGSGNGTRRVDKYNINTNTWLNIDSMPITLANFSAARLKDTIYTVGGLINTYFSSETNIVQKYDISANTWTTRASLPIVTGWPESVGYQDSLIYCLGGMINGSTTGTNAVWLYNCYTNSWRAATSLPTNRMGGGCAMVGDTIVYACGSNGWGGYTDHTTYRGVISQSDRSSITWTTGTPYPGSNYWRFIAASWGCRGMIMAGGCPNGFTTGQPECYVYSPGGNTWTSRPNMTHPTSTAAVGSLLFSSSAYIYKLVVASGLRQSTPYTVVWTQIFTDTLPCGPPPPPVNIPWCEGFTSTTFPPLNWYIGYNYTPYWLRNASVSGYGLGTGSAYYNAWNAPIGESQDFITVNFTPIYSETWSVQFDYAYAPVPETPPYWPDSLIIRISSNSGTTWTLLIGYGPLELQTAPAQNSEFVPLPAQWSKKTLGLPIGTNRIDFQGVSSYGNDIYLDSICVLPVLGIKHSANDIPNTYSLSQNYPNPFNPSTTINYDLPRAGNVRLVVYDVLGKEINIIVNEVQKAGSYRVTWDGSKFASGIYFYRIESGTFTDVKKMVLIK